MADPDISDIERRMHSALDVLKKELAGLRTGRASAALLEPIQVEAYGSKLPLSQVGTISVPDARMISVQVWDKGQVKAVEKAIRDGGLGLNPQVDGGLIRVPIPQLSQERRQELTKVANKYAEQARIAVRNVRRDGMDHLKRLEKSGDISQDDQRLWADEIQSLTDSHIKAIDEAVAQKDKEIMQV
ncbi:MAG: ribosome recycling factor [Rhodospirillales bacterium]